MNTQLIALSILATVLPTPALAYTMATGNVTPDGMKITVTGATLLTADNVQVGVYDATTEVEFTRAGANFAAIPMGTITVPFGRYIGVTLRFDDRYKVKLNGAKYIGTTQGALASGDAVYTGTEAADSSVAGTVSETVPAEAKYVTLPHVSHCTDCSSTTWFAQPACVAASAADCQAGDQWVGGDGTTLPDLNVLVDLYQSINIDGNDMSISRGAVYPFVVVGSPGAAVHIVAGDQTAQGSQNVSILFGSDKKIHSIATWGGGGAAAIVGPTGGNWITATSAPAGAAVNAYGPNMISEFDSTGTGSLKFPQGNCPTSSCTSSGLATLTGFLAAPGSTVAFSCTADTTGALGWTYTGGDCSSITTGNMKVGRIIDPNNILGVCTTGTCAATNADVTGTAADGYL